MPSYEFFCEACKQVSEEFFTSMKNVPDFITCSQCGQQAKRQVSTGEAFHLKGTGWYRDGYTGESNRRWIKTEE